MIAREFLRRQWAQRRRTSFIPIQTFGFAEFDPSHIQPRHEPPSPSRDTSPTAEARPPAGDDGAQPSSPAFSDP